MTLDNFFESLNTPESLNKYSERLKKLRDESPAYEFIGDDPDHWSYSKTGVELSVLDVDITNALSKFLIDYPQYIKDEVIVKAFMGSGIGTNFILFDSNGKAIADLTDYYNW